MNGTLADPADTVQVHPAPENGALKRWQEARRNAEERASGIVAIHWHGEGNLQGEDDARFRKVLVRYSVLRALGHRRTATVVMARFERALRMELRARRLSRLRRIVLTKCSRTRTTRSTRRTTRVRRAATKKAAATSTGDPDPEPSGDARARLRSVALIEAAPVGGGL